MQLYYFRRFFMQKPGIFTKCLLLIILGVFVLGPVAFQTPDAQAYNGILPQNISELAETARPGVVNIRTVRTVKQRGRVLRPFPSPFGENDPFKDFFAPFFGEEMPHEFKQQSLGSGFVIDREGYIVTNNHVIDDADQIKVRLSNKKEFDAEVIGRDPKTDLALIKIAPSKDLKPLGMGDSDTLRVGTWVVAIGSPFGLEQTVTAGIVSAKGRVIGSGPYDDFIQTDASINPGNSGGPLLNMDGKVVGINTAIVASGQGIGFAIPINLAAGIIEQLKESGKVTRAWLGVGIQDLTSELAEYYGIEQDKGVLVTKVYEGNPAAEAGIRPNDLIISVNGHEVSSSRELSRIIAESPIDEKTEIRLIRNGKEKKVAVRLKQRDDEDLSPQQSGESRSQLGIQLREMNPEMARRFGFEESEKGVLVTAVQPGSKAAQAGIQQGDLIREINHSDVRTIKDFKEKFDRIQEGQPVRLLIRRGHHMFLVIKMIK
jgi:serine protease Do